MTFFARKICYNFIVMDKQYFVEKFKIGSRIFDNNILLAPMAGVTDRAFRILCKEQGAGITFSEMISAKGLHYDSKKSLDLGVLDPIEEPGAVQIFGSEPEYMAEAAEIFCERGVSMIDINMGCPMPKITSNGDGSALMNNPSLACKIVEAITSRVNIPVSVKMRRGYDSKKEEQAVELAKAVEAGGASMVTVHGRYRDQLYTGTSDRGIIRQVKEAVKIPVIGNGDIISPEDVKNIMVETGCDGVMIGRGTYGNPWIFSEIKNYFTKNERAEAVSHAELKNTMLRHLNLTVQFKGEYTGIREMRPHLSWYLKGLHGSAAMRNKICRAESVSELQYLIEEFFTLLEERGEHHGQE